MFWKKINITEAGMHDLSMSCFQTIVSPQTFGSLLANTFPEGFTVVCRESCACMFLVDMQNGCVATSHQTLSEVPDPRKRTLAPQTWPQY